MTRGRYYVYWLWIVCFAASLTTWTQTDRANGQPYGTFANVTELPGLDSPYADEEPFVTSDGLTVYFSSDRAGVRPEDPRDVENYDLYVSRRESITKPFGEPMPLESVNVESVVDHGAWVSDDQLRIYFYSRREGGAGDGDLYIASRPSVGAPWNEAQNIAELNTTSSEIVPHLTDDELTIFYSGTQNGSYDVFTATRESVDAPFTAPRALDGVNVPEYVEWDISMSSDGLFMFYGTDRPPSGGFISIWVAQRHSLDKDFSDPVNINSFASGSYINLDPGSEFGPQISSDWPAPGSKLYFSRARSPRDFDLMEATWYVGGDMNLDGKVEFADFVIFSIRFGKRARSFSDGDFNLDRRVDFADFLILSANFEGSSRTAAVPEPCPKDLLLWSLILATTVVPLRSWLRDAAGEISRKHR